jgi:hypothetical protein
MALAALGNVAAVTQLVGNAGGLISKITKGAKKARQNKVDCEHLASRLSTIGGILYRLPPTAYRGTVQKCRRRLVIDHRFSP